MRLDPRRFGDGDDRGRAVDGCAGRVDDARAVELGGNLEEVDRRSDVVLVVGQGDFGRFADGLVCLCTRSHMST